MSMREPLFATLPRPRPMPLAGRRVLVLGLGESGLAAARWAAQEGARVLVADSRESPPGRAGWSGEFRGGPFDAGLLEGADLLCLSPGLALSEPVVLDARARGLPIVGEIELFAWAVRGRSDARVLAITGTNGKSTVTALAGHLLKSAGIDAEVAGNISPAALDALRLRERRPPRYWVLELSSYQLETTWSLEPEAAAMLNLSEDHLDRYAGLAEYGAAKARIFFGGGAQVLNRADAASMAQGLPGRPLATFGTDAPPLAEDWGLVDHGGQPWLARGAERLLPVAELPLAGLHNAANALAACALAVQAGVPLKALPAALRSFRGLPHRMERVAVHAGVEWLDDSKGTNVGATVAALRGLSRKAVLILGGVGKGQDFSPLAPAVRERAAQVLLIGRDAPLIGRALAGTGVPMEECATLEDAVRRAAALARPGEAVLLSPACASFDMFRDYKQRGEVFAALARGLR